MHTEKPSQPVGAVVVQWDGGSRAGAIQMFFIFLLQSEMYRNVSCTFTEALRKYNTPSALWPC